MSTVNRIFGQHREVIRNEQAFRLFGQHPIIRGIHLPVDKDKIDHRIIGRPLLKSVEGATNVAELSGKIKAVDQHVPLRNIIVGLVRVSN